MTDEQNLFDGMQFYVFTRIILKFLYSILDITSASPRYIYIYIYIYNSLKVKLTIKSNILLKYLEMMT